MKEPWDQLESESDEAFARFLIYRNIGPARSLQAAYEAYLASFENAIKSRKKPQVPGHWGDDSKRYHWVSRSSAWDIDTLQKQGPELARLWMSILLTAARKAGEELNKASCKPKGFMQAIAIIDRLTPYLTPDALKSMQPAGNIVRPELIGDGIT